MAWPNLALATLELCWCTIFSIDYQLWAFTALKVIIPFTILRICSAQVLELFSFTYQNQQLSVIKYPCAVDSTVYSIVALSWTSLQHSKPVRSSTSVAHFWIFCSVVSSTILRYLSARPFFQCPPLARSLPTVMQNLQIKHPAIQSAQRSHPILFSSRSLSILQVMQETQQSKAEHALDYLRKDLSLSHYSFNIFPFFLYLWCTSPWSSASKPHHQQAPGLIFFFRLFTSEHSLEQDMCSWFLRSSSCKSVVRVTFISILFCPRTTSHWHWSANQFPIIQHVKQRIIYCPLSGLTVFKNQLICICPSNTQASHTFWTACTLIFCDLTISFFKSFSVSTHSSISRAKYPGAWNKL